MTPPDEIPKPLTGKSREPDWDPVYLHARREALVAIGLFTFFCVWSLTVCYTMGYLGPTEAQTSVSTVLGMPAWAFWGIALPWIVVDIVAVWFCFFYMANDDLGEANQEAEMHPDGRPPEDDVPPSGSGEQSEGPDHV